MSRDNKKNFAMDKKVFTLSYRNSTNSNNPFSKNNGPFSKPITFANYIHRHHKKNTVSQISNFDRLKQSQPKGFIFVWPQRRKFYYEKEFSLFTWILAHGLFWLHVINVFPNGSGMFLTQPPWRYIPPLPKPQNRDYIIEPDWDSNYS